MEGFFISVPALQFYLLTPEFLFSVSKCIPVGFQAGIPERYNIYYCFQYSCRNYFQSFDELNSLFQIV